MKPATTILKPLQRLAWAGRVRALFRTIDHPDAAKDRVNRALDTLIGAIAKHELPPELARDASEGLFRRWERLPAVQRARLMKVDGAVWRAGLARVACDEAVASRLTVARLAGRWPVREAILAAGRLVGDSDDVVSGEAVASLMKTAQGAADLSPNASAALDETLTRLARLFPEHRRKPILRAVLAVGRHAGPELTEWLAAGADAEIMPLRGVMKETGALTRSEAVRYLAIPALAATAADRLAQPASAAEHESSLALSPLLHSRRRSMGLKRLSDPFATLPDQPALQRLSLGSRMGALHWADAIPVTSSRRAVALTQMLADPEPVVRCGAVRRLGRLAEVTSVAGDGLRDAVFDDDPAVALAALRELHRIDPALAEEGSRRLVRSPHAEVRAAAQRMLRVSDPWALIERDDAMGWRLLRQRLADEPLRTLAMMRGRIAEGTPASRTLAVLAARRLTLVGELENELLAAATGDEERVASSAVLALGDAESAASRAAVSSCLAHPDARVRSNAVEAIARRDPDEPVVKAWVENEIPRARANAVRARVLLAKDASAVGSLAKMLSDERRSHRLSGLWVAERAGTIAVSERVAEIARTEREPHVRERARRCARRLLAEMRWNDPSPAASRARTVFPA